MAHFNIHRLSKALGLSAEAIQAYCKIQTPRDIVPVAQRRAKLATIKDHPVQANEVEIPKTDENEVYAQWRDASPEEKEVFERELFGNVHRHARAVIFQTIHQANKDLAHDITSTVITQLADFKGKSKFSTWVHRIILNHCYDYIRRTTVERERFYASENPQDDIRLKDDKAEGAFYRVDQALDLEPLKRLIEELPNKDYVLLDCRLDGLTIQEAATKLGDSEDAVESRWRRVRSRLRKKIRGMATENDEVKELI
jgi:RNA polymerase sigma factor (sigma-70 family)